MKQEFSTSWQSSVQRRKQHKYIANSPFHIKHRFLSANLSKSLRAKYGKRNLPLRKGDEVLVMRGSFKKKKAKITSIDVKHTKIFLENIQRTKKDGTKVNFPFHASVLQIQSLNLDDRKRSELLNKKSSAPAAQVTDSAKADSKKDKQEGKEKRELKTEKKNASN